MHDELKRYGLRRANAWSIGLAAIGVLCGAGLAALAMFEAEWAPSEWVAGGAMTVLIGAALGLGGVVMLMAVAERAGSRRAWPTVSVVPAPNLVSLAEGLALARGAQLPRVWGLQAAAPNVACIAHNGERHLVVSASAVTGLSRDELEAIMSLQFSLLTDEAASRVRRALVAAALMVVWTIRLGVIALVVVIVRRPSIVGLTVNIAFWLTFVLVILVRVVQKRLRWAWGIVGDAVAIETTRHPEPLVTALRRLAGHNEGRAPVKGSFGATDPYWAVSVRANVKVEMFVVNDVARRRTSTALQSDAALLLRARIVELSLLGGRPATLASWREAEATFKRLSRAAGDDEGAKTVDPTVHGVTVTPEGATTGALPPRSGTWPAPDRRGIFIHFRRKHPNVPDASVLVAYEQSVAQWTATNPFTR